MIFSTPIPPPNIGVGLESAKFHQTKEFSDLQDNLKEKIKYCRELLDEEKIPEISQNP